MILEIAGITGVVFGISTLAYTYDKLKEVESHKILDTKIDIKKHQLQQLEMELSSRSIDRNTYLTQLETDVLNIYDDSNIRIPVEIIEDLSHRKLDNKKDIQFFIESQRHYWKLENNKKPFVRSELK